MRILKRSTNRFSNDYLTTIDTPIRFSYNPGVTFSLGFGFYVGDSYYFTKRHIRDLQSNLCYENN